MKRSSSRPPHRQRSHAPVKYRAAQGAYASGPLRSDRRRSEAPEDRRTPAGLGPYEMTYDVSHGYGMDRSIVMSERTP